MSTNDVWQFPCQLDLKIVGEQRTSFSDEIVAAIQHQIPGDYSVRETPSSGGRYVSVTVAVHFGDREQLQSVYAALRKIAGVKMVL